VFRGLGIEKIFNRERCFSLLIGIIGLGAWEWLVHTEILSALFFPSPTVIFQTLMQGLIQGEFLSHIGITLSRMLTGGIAGIFAGLLAGLCMGWSPRLRAVADPFIAAAHPLPKIAILPLIMIIFGIGEMSKIVVIAVSAFFPMVINTVSGVRQINPVYFEVAENYGAKPFKVFTRVIIPGSLPMIMTGVRLAVNRSLVITIASELVSAQKGLGAMIWLAWETLRTEELYASLLITAVLGICFNALVQFATNRLVPWQEGVN
jgi:NitT/TauT family transport system permease protein